VDQILDVLKKDNVISAWLDSDENRDPELFVLLADKLPQSERDALTDVAHVVISKKDNLAARISTLERENQHLRSLSLTDGLTGLYNYRFFAKQLKIEMARTKRTGQPCSLIMIDLDDFKLLNDTRLYWRNCALQISCVDMEATNLLLLCQQHTFLMPC
jgi:predicted signal transduction protein with EAL and GGDEF domain